MDKANDSFIECKRIAGDTSSSDIDRENALNSYLREKKAVHYEVLNKEAGVWSSLVASNSKSLWATIDWNGNYTRKMASESPISR